MGWNHKWDADIVNVQVCSNSVLPLLVVHTQHLHELKMSLIPSIVMMQTYKA